MITDKDIQQQAHLYFPDVEMDYEQQIDAGNQRQGFEIGVKWALAVADQCHTFHEGYKVFKCATTCAGLQNCRLKNNPIPHPKQSVAILCSPVEEKPRKDFTERYDKLAGSQSFKNAYDDRSTDIPVEEKLRNEHLISAIEKQFNDSHDGARAQTELRRQIIKEHVVVNKANLEYIAETGEINGTLLQGIEMAMIAYAVKIKYKS